MNPRGILKILFFILIVCSSELSTGQNIEKTKDISVLMDSLRKIDEDSQKLILKKKINEQLHSLLLPASSFKFSLDSLRKVGAVKSPDDRFRIITWNLPLKDGTYNYSGIIQMNPGKEQTCKLYMLDDVSYSVKEKINSATFIAPQWFGALYFQIVKNKVNDKIVYTLLATRFNDIFTNQKIIESLYFDENDLPVFGYPMFEHGPKLEKRIIFEYSIKAVMSMRYYDNLKMIVYDHLAPSSPIYTGNYKFYGPDFTFDAFKFEKDKWIYLPNVNFKNPK